jgi:hypothetical protein
VQKIRTAELGVAAALLLLAPLSARAEPFEPRNEYEELIGRPKSIPRIPANLASILRATSPKALLVKGLDGNEIAVDIEWIEPEAYRLYAAGRYLGFTFLGYEYYGYTLVDRAATGKIAVIDTGQAPVFSPDGRFFAAAEMSDAGFNNLEGIGLWEKLPDRSVRRFYTDAARPGWDWRVDRWAVAGCVSLSAIGSDWQPPSGEDWEAAKAGAPRRRYALTIDGQNIELRMAGETVTCTEDQSPP